MDTRVFHGATQHTPHTTHHTHHNTRHNTTQHTQPQHHTETETDTDRQREKEDRDRERREDGSGETRQEKREDSFSMWWCMSVFCWCSDFLVNSVCPRDLSLLNSVKYESYLISYSALWQFNFFYSLNFFWLRSYSFKIFQNYLVMQLQFSRN